METNGVKVINFEPFWMEFSDFKKKAKKELNQKFADSFVIDFYELQGGIYNDGLPTKIGVSVWSSGTITPDMARKYASTLNRAAELADEFIYNDYIVTFKGNDIYQEIIGKYAESA